MNRYVLISAIAMFFACIDAFGGMLGFWSITHPDDRVAIVAFELGTLALLLVNSLLIKNKFKHDTEIYQLAWFCTLSITVCMFGDIVNFNLGQTFYNHSNVVMHDYLIDSIIFFAPGYALLLVAIAKVLLRFYSFRTLTFACLLTMIVASFCYNSMVIQGSGRYVISLSFAYSLLISLPACASVLLLLHSFARRCTGMWLLALGLALATIADAIIGAFWIFGNNGAGFFPLAREINWVLYIASQSIVIHLPRVVAAINLDMQQTSVRLRSI